MKNYFLFLFLAIGSLSYDAFSMEGEKEFTPPPLIDEVLQKNQSDFAIITWRKENFPMLFNALKGAAVLIPYSLFFYAKELATILPITSEYYLKYYASPFSLVTYLISFKKSKKKTALMHKEILEDIENFGVFIKAFKNLFEKIHISAKEEQSKNNTFWNDLELSNHTVNEFIKDVIREAAGQFRSDKRIQSLPIGGNESSKILVVFSLLVLFSDKSNAMHLEAKYPTLHLMFFDVFTLSYFSHKKCITNCAKYLFENIYLLEKQEEEILKLAQQFDGMKTYLLQSMAFSQSKERN